MQSGMMNRNSMGGCDRTSGRTLGYSPQVFAALIAYHPGATHRPVAGWQDFFEGDKHDPH
jgi:hypothetical protein